MACLFEFAIVIVCFGSFSYNYCFVSSALFICFFLCFQQLFSLASVTMICVISSAADVLLYSLCLRLGLAWTLIIDCFPNSCLTFSTLYVRSWHLVTLNLLTMRNNSISPRSATDLVFG